MVEGGAETIELAGVSTVWVSIDCRILDNKPSMIQPLGACSTSLDDKILSDLRPTLAWQYGFWYH